jgi:hypothetical protein
MEWEKHYDEEEKKEQKQFLEKDDFWEWCMWCQHQFKELSEKEKECADCIFNTIANIS